MVIAADLDEANFPELPLLHDGILGLDQVRRAAALRADLDDTLMFARRGEHGLSFHDVHANRLLDIDIRPGFDRGHHCERMPMVRRADEHDVQVFFFEHLPIIAVGAWPFFRSLPARYGLGGFCQHLFIHVAERHYFDRRDLD